VHADASGTDTPRAIWSPAPAASSGRRCCWTAPATFRVRRAWTAPPAISATRPRWARCSMNSAGAAHQRRGLHGRGSRRGASRSGAGGERDAHRVCWPQPAPSAASACCTCPRISSSTVRAAVPIRRMRRPHRSAFTGAASWPGERAVTQAAADALILRTGWVYSQRATISCCTMLRLHASATALSRGRRPGRHTHGRHSLAEALWAAASATALRGIYHWSDAGVCSWYDFAVAIGEEGEALGLLERAPGAADSTAGLPHARPAARLQRARQDATAGATWRDGPGTGARSCAA
jgi:hypothetical protein